MQQKILARGHVISAEEEIAESVFMQVRSSHDVFSIPDIEEVLVEMNFT